ncbi:MAG: DNA primase [Burkholderiaceae bacterium]|jgi:DNA primase|nr:DNA primase [Burkholderiaceae bacterium]
MPKQVIPQAFIQDLLDRVDIADVVGKYVNLKKAGANWLGLCPFHTEKTPSFTVSSAKQFYHCFGCGKNGSAIGFLMEHAGMGFIDAVRELAGSAGMTVPTEKGIAGADQQKARRAAQEDIMAQAGQFYRRQLKESSSAITYLKGRGLTGETAARFGLGYAPEKPDALRTVFSDYDDETLVETGLVIDKDAVPRRRYDRFRGRIMFPIRNGRGHIVGFGARTLGKEEPKYLNSPETPLFQKGNELYGLFEARNAIRDAGYALVVEGYMDVLALAQSGFPQTVATLGTACTPAQIQKIMRQTNNVVFSFDGDKAGRSAARKALEAGLPHVTDNRGIRFLFLPDEHDPDSFIRRHSADAFREQLRQAMPLSEFLFHEVTKECDLLTMEGRARAQYTAKPLLRTMQASALRQQIIHKLAEITHTDDREMVAWLGTEKGEKARSYRLSPRQPRSPVVGVGRHCIRFALAYPQMTHELSEADMALMERFDPEHAKVLSDLVNTVHAVGENTDFSAIVAYWRATGHDHEKLTEETQRMLDEGLTRENAWIQLRGCLLQMETRLVAADMETLSSLSSLDASQKEQYYALQAKLQDLKKQIADGR